MMTSHENALFGNFIFPCKHKGRNYRFQYVKVLRTSQLKKMRFRNCLLSGNLWKYFCDFFGIHMVLSLNNLKLRKT